MAKITDLQYQKRNKNRVNIFVDDVFFAGASLESVMRFGLKKDKDIDEQKIKEFLLVDEKQKALTKATDLISKFVKTEKQIYDYLKAKGFSDETVSETINKMKEYGFINDKQYVESFVSFKKNVCGIKKIKQELFHKGISKQLIDSVDLMIDNSEDLCICTAEKYMKNKEKTKENAVKLNRFLISKGFDFADVKSAVNKIIKEGEDESWD